MKKVTAKHLMIGDWVEYKGSKRSVFNTHLYNDNSSEMWIEVDDKQLMVKSATPIPITEEWLKLNGWEWKENEYGFAFYKKSNDIIIRMYGEKGFSIQTNNGLLSCFPNTEYIHQLQQAYRLATGKELKVKF